MSKLNSDTILEDLEQYNQELNLEEYQLISLNNYNNQFRSKLLTSINTLSVEEINCLKHIEDTTSVIDTYKEEANDIVDSKKNIFEVECEEKNQRNRESYDKELKEINEEINSFEGLFDKQISSIADTSYYKRLDITQTNRDYDKYLSDIKQNYSNSLDFFHSRKESRISSLEGIAKQSKNELEEKLKKIEELFNSGNFTEDTTINIKIEVLKKEIEDNEQLIVKQKKEIDSQIEKISSKYKVLLDLDVTPIKSHIGYLKQIIADAKQELKDNEIKCLDSFKLNLEIIDKQLEVHKIKTTKRQKEIKNLLSQNNDIELQKEFDYLDHSTVILNESMRAKKIEFDIKKNYDIELLHLNYENKKNKITNQISLFQKRISVLENTHNLQEYIQFGKLRNDMEIEEIKVKNELDNLKQEIHLAEAIDKLSVDFYNSIHEYQKELHNTSVLLNEKYFNSIKNKITTLTSLEIEKNLILKNYNINSNDLLKKKNELYLDIIKLEEQHEIANKRLSNELEKKILSQDIQLANKKFELFKKINLLEKQYKEQELINEYNYKLETKTYNVFENRFSIEKKLYKLYFENIKNVIESTELYFNKYNNITKCFNKNITFATFNYLTTYLKTEVISLLKKTINVISNRITFEGTVNFQYELNRLITEKDQNTRWYNTSIEKITETIKNYEKTIVLFTNKIETTSKESDLVKNQLILKDLEIAHTDVKNTTLISKLHQDIEILSESISAYDKEIKLYKELIIKNKKVIGDFNKTIPNIKSKYTKIADKISTQLNTIEKRHKQESSVYYNFITKIEGLIKEINQELTLESIKESVYSYFKEYTTSIYSSILNFEVNAIDNLFNKLSKRHESILDSSNKKFIALVEETDYTYNSDSKHINDEYADNIFEIEKKIDKLQSVYSIRTKESLNKFEDKVYEIKSKIRQVEIEQNRKKAEFLFDINSFTENIDEFNSSNNKNILVIKQERSNLTKKYFDYNEYLNKEKINKQKSLELQCSNVISSLKTTYNGIINEKKIALESKTESYKTRIDDIYKEFTLSTAEFNSNSATKDVEYSLVIKNLDKKLEFDLYSLKKSSIAKINKENRKFNRLKYTN